METKGFKEKFKEAWANPRKKAAIKLGFYLIFMLGVCLLVAIGSNMGSKLEDIPEISDELKKATFDDKLLKLLNNNYSYTYEIYESGVRNTVFTGVKLNNRELGFKETALENIKYLIEDNLVYKINLNEKVLISNLYENIDYEYFNLLYIKNIIINATKTEMHDEENNLYYNYTNIGENLNIYFDEENITEIVIDKENVKYILKYNKIGEIKEENLNY